MCVFFVLFFGVIVFQIPGLKEDYKSLNLHINIAELVMAGSGSAEFRRRWQAERAMLEGDDCFEVQNVPNDKHRSPCTPDSFCFRDPVYQAQLYNS